MLLSKSEARLQKKGIENMDENDLQIWIQLCERNEIEVKYNKARRSWKISREEVEKRLEKIIAEKKK